MSQLATEKLDPTLQRDVRTRWQALGSRIISALRRRMLQQERNLLCAGLGALTKWRGARPAAGKPIRRVIHVSPAYFDADSYIGGGERYPTSLALAMSELVETRLVTFGPKRISRRRDQLQLEVYPCRELINGSPYDPHCLAFLRELCQADAIHVHQYAPFVSSLTVLAAALLKRPNFVTDLGGGGWNASRQSANSRFVTEFCPISAFAIRDFERNKATIIHGGVDATFLAEPAAPWPRPNGVLYVGRLLPHKGINYLIEAMPADLPLTIMGPAYHADYLRMLKGLAASKRVTFVTDASDAALRDAYRAATVTVLPSVYKDCYGNTYDRPELLGLTLLESQACGTPAICTAVGGMPEFVSEGVTGFVVPPNSPGPLRQAIERICGNLALAEKLGSNGRRAVEERYTWRHVAENCLQIYTKVCGEPRSRGPS